MQWTGARWATFRQRSRAAFTLFGQRKPNPSSPTLTFAMQPRPYWSDSIERGLRPDSSILIPITLNRMIP